MSKQSTLLALVIVVLAGWLMLGKSRVTSPASVGTEDIKADLHSLHERLTELEKKVAQLWELRPNFPALMPEFSERFHVLHYAGEAGDWAVAQHELLEMRRLVRLGGLIDAQKGVLLQAFIHPQLEGLLRAIEDQNGQAFKKALESTVQACNGCHAAVGSAFMKVALDPPDVLSLRHPHALTRSQVPKHEHGHRSHRGR